MMLLIAIFLSKVEAIAPGSESVSQSLNICINICQTCQTVAEGSKSSDSKMPKHHFLQIKFLMKTSKAFSTTKRYHVLLIRYNAGL